MDIFSTFTWDWNQVGADFIRITLSFLLTLPIAWQRYADPGGTTGFRTFPIVAVASCGYLLIAKHAPGADADTQARIIQGLLAGMGFIGGGAILKQGGDVRGLAIAASIWNIGAIGAAVGYEREEIAVVLSIINFFLLRFLTPIVLPESSPNQEDDYDQIQNKVKA
jgi:putative Mg2+ transporter-C (MgtC) family protein